jgi:hypothetical protein
VQTSSVVTIFMPHSLSTNGQLNHTRSMSQSDLELQYDHVSAVMPIIQQKYSNIVLTFWIPLISVDDKSNVLQYSILQDLELLNVVLWFPISKKMK